MSLLKVSGDNSLLSPYVPLGLAGTEVVRNGAVLAVESNEVTMVVVSGP